MKSLRHSNHTINRLFDASSPQQLANNSVIDITPNASKDDNELLAVTNLLQRAHGRRVSHIYLEPADGFSRIRMRIAEQLEEEIDHDIKSFQQLCKTLKTLAEIGQQTDYGTHAGSFTTRLFKQLYNIQLLVFKMQYGESLTITMQPQYRDAPTLDELNIRPRNLNTLRQLSKKRCGLTLITGPEKLDVDHTLYGIAQELNAPDKKIFSIEKKVLYRLPRINQLEYGTLNAEQQSYLIEQCNEQHPNSLIVSSGNHPVLIQAATECAYNLSVFIGVSTSSVSHFIEKLFQLLPLSYNLGGLLNGYTVQHNVMEICANCKQLHHLNDIEKTWIKSYYPAIAIVDGHYAIGKGCDSCANTGNGNRLTIYSVQTINNEMQDALSSRDILKFNSALSLHEDFEQIGEKAVRMAAKGKITLQQAMSIHR